MQKSNTNNVALAGEFAVLSQLALENYDANMTLGNTKGVDILVSDSDTGKMYRLEVKTTIRATDKEETNSKIFGRYLDNWMMSKKHETMIDPLLFYCFVIIWPNTKPRKSEFFIVPSGVVARYVKEEHDLWRRFTNGKENEVRTFRIGFEGETYKISTPLKSMYEDNWDFHR